MKKIFSIPLNPQRIFGLDILRAFAIIFVMLGHGESILPPILQKVNGFIYLDGVSIFFVLSGFLIGGILIKILIKSTFNISTLLDFWSRRWFRTIPNYFLILSFLFLYYFFINPDFNILDYKSYLIFSQNLYYPHPSFFPEAWSLSVEEWFYLTVPAFIFLLLNFSLFSVRNTLLIVIIGLILFITAYRFYEFTQLTSYSIQNWDLNFRKQVITRLDSIMFGVLGAYLSHYHKNLWSKNSTSLFIAGIISFIIIKVLTIIGVISVNGAYHYIFSFTVTSLSTLALIPFLSKYRNNKTVWYKPLTYISILSYSMYLLNYSIVKKILLKKYYIVLKDHVPQWLNYIIEYSLFWGITIIVSIFIYKYYEVPTTKLRDKKTFLSRTSIRKV